MAYVYSDELCLEKHTTRRGSVLGPNQPDRATALDLLNASFASHHDDAVNHHSQLRPPMHATLHVLYSTSRAALVDDRGPDRVLPERVTRSLRRVYRPPFSLALCAHCCRCLDLSSKGTEYLDLLWIAPWP